MNTPKMIIFDYGHTLCHEPGFNAERGAAAVLKHAVRNKYNVTAEQIRSLNDMLYGGIARESRALGAEIHNFNFQRFIFEYLRIEFDLPPEQLERLFWDGASYGELMPDADKVLAYLKKRGIRSGVISNISFSGANLKHRLDRLLPDNEFEFVIASSEYMLRKPNHMLFELALRKAGLSAGEVWYCGDNTDCDVAGAAGAGIFPVWYHSYIECDYRDKSLDARPQCEHLYIRDWLELIEYLT